VDVPVFAIAVADVDQASRHGRRVVNVAGCGIYPQDVASSPIQSENVTVGIEASLSNVADIDSPGAYD